MKYESQVWGAGVPAFSKALVLAAHRCWVSLPKPHHSFAPHLQEPAEALFDLNNPIDYQDLPYFGVYSQFDTIA